LRKKEKGSITERSILLKEMSISTLKKLTITSSLSKILYSKEPKNLAVKSVHPSTNFTTTT
jgi:hypothetical protein